MKNGQNDDSSLSEREGVELWELSRDGGRASEKEKNAEFVTASCGASAGSYSINSYTKAFALVTKHSKS